MVSKLSSGGPLEEFTARPRLRIVLPMRDPAATRRFYEDTLGCRLVAEHEDGLELDFFGCRLLAQAVPKAAADLSGVAPGLLPQIGLIMGWEDWHRAVDHLNYVGVRYLEPPTFKARGEADEQAQFCIADPSGNCLAFVTYRDPGRV